MRKLFISIMLLLCVGVQGQDKAGIGFSQNFSTFRFRNSAGIITDLSYSLKYGYGISYQKEISKHFRAEGFMEYNYKGANSTAEHELVDWQFHYANAGVSGLVSLGHDRLVPFLGAGVYYGFLLRADQFFGSTYYNLISRGNINRNDFGINLFAGMEYNYSSNTSVFLRTNGALGLIQLEEENSAQELYNRTFSVQMGLHFTISKTE